MHWYITVLNSKTLPLFRAALASSSWPSLGALPLDPRAPIISSRSCARHECVIIKSLKWALISGHSDAQPWASECPDVKNYKWWLNPPWHGMLHSCTHVAPLGVKGLSRMSARGRCRISQSCLLAEYRKRRLNQGRPSFVLLRVFCVVCFFSCI